MFSSSFFQGGYIPTLPTTRSYYPTDTSNYPDIRTAALELEGMCIDDEPDPFQYGGWRSVGMRQSIGVFLWSTNSLMNRRVGRAANGFLDLTRINETVNGWLNDTAVEKK